MGPSGKCGSEPRLTRRLCKGGSYPSLCSNSAKVFQGQIQARALVWPSALLRPVGSAGQGQWHQPWACWDAASRTLPQTLWIRICKIFRMHTLWSPGSAALRSATGPASPEAPSCPPSPPPARLRPVRRATLLVHKLTLLSGLHTLSSLFPGTFPLLPLGLGTHLTWSHKASGTQLLCSLRHHLTRVRCSYCPPPHPAIALCAWWQKDRLASFLLCPQHLAPRRCPTAEWNWY